MRRSLISMRDLQVSPPRFKITKLRFGILDGVNTFARAKVLRSVTPRDLVAHDIPSARYVGTRYVGFADAICFASRNVRVKIRLADFSDFIIFRLGFRLGADFAAWGAVYPPNPPASGRAGFISLDKLNRLSSAGDSVTLFSFAVLFD